MTLKSLPVLGAMMLLGGCSTIVTGTTQPFTVKTKQALGAECVLKDTKERVWRISSTPQTVEVNKGDGPMTITCSKEGYKTATLVVEESFAGATLGNIILGGGIGVIVDAASGAAQEYPDDATLWLEPLEWSSEEEKQEWLSAKQAFEDEQAKKNQPQS